MSRAEAMPDADEREAVGGWDADAARGYFEFNLAETLSQFRDLYGPEALQEQVSKVMELQS